MEQHLPQIITSLLDNDFYKFSMGEMYMHQFTGVNVEWHYKNRDSATRKFTQEMVDEIKWQIQKFCELKFTEDELTFLSKSATWLTKDYISFLTIYQPQFKHFQIGLTDDGQLDLWFRGPMFLVSYYETPVMSIISEVWFKMSLSKEEYAKAEQGIYDNLKDKLSKVKDNTYRLGVFSEFGTRRRFSKSTFDDIIGALAYAKSHFELGSSTFVGTSNVEMAMKYNVKPVGTMAHEAIMMFQGFPEYNPAYSNKLMMDAWHKEYGTENGIYLTDCITTDCFLKDFNKVNAKLFDGVRHDSGDTYVWANKMIEHYEKLGIDPTTKTLLFSDSLDFKKATDLYNCFNNRAKVAFGIGTYIANDSGVVKAMNQVIKVTEVNGTPVCKLSDDMGKFMGKSEEYLAYLKRCIDWRLNH